MKNIILFIVLVILLSCNKARNIKTEQNKKITYERIAIQGNENYYGFVSSKGDTVIPLGKYDFLDSLDIKGMIRTHNNGKEGFIDINQSIVIPFDYYRVSNFSENLAAVKKDKDGKEGYINRKGELVIDYRFDSARWFYNGIADVEIDNKTGFIDKNGNIVIPIEYDYVISTKADNFVAVSKNDKLAFFSNKGKQLTDFIFDEVHKRDIENDYVVGAYGLVLVSKKDKYSYLDNSLKTVIPFGKYDYAETFTKDRLAIVRQKNKYGVINDKGELLIPLEYDLIEHPSIYSYEFSEFITKKSGKYGLLNGEGTTILNNDYDEIIWDRLKRDEKQEDYYIYKKNGKCGAVNTKNEVILPFEFEELTEFSYQDFTIAKKNGKFGVIKSDAKTIVQFEYDMIDCNKSKHWCNLLILNKGGKTGLADINGIIIIPVVYKQIIPCYYEPTDRFIVEKDSKFGVIDLKQKIVIPIIYDSISNWVEYGPEGHYITINKKKGLISREGKTLIEPIYDDFELLGVHTKVTNNGKYGLLDISNNLILPIEYDEIYLDWFETDYEGKNTKEFYARKKGKYYLFDNKGNIIKENVSHKNLKDKIGIN